MAVNKKGMRKVNYKGRPFIQHGKTGGIRSTRSIIFRKLVNT